MKNRYEVRGEVTAIFIKCSRGHVEAIIDTGQLERVSSFPNTWYAMYSKKTNSYYVNGSMTAATNKRINFGIHRWIMGLPKGKEVDHIDHNTLNNTLENLRIVTSGENKQNKRGARSDSSSGVRGVIWSGSLKKWIVRITVNGERKFFGSYDDVKTAEVVSVEARKRYMPFSMDA